MYSHQQKGTTVKPTEHSPKASPATTGFFAALRVFPRLRGTGAPSADVTHVRLLPIIALFTLATLSALVGLLALSSSPALALTFARQIPGFTEPQGVAVNAVGDVYVADGAGKAVSEYSPAGVRVGELNGSETPQREFGNPRGVAVDGKGDVYVAESDFEGIVDEFNTTGGFLPPQLLGSDFDGHFEEFIGLTGIGVDDSTSPSDPSAGDVYVAALTTGLDKFSPSGETLAVEISPASAGAEEMHQVAVDASGDVYLAKGKVVDEFSPTGVLLETLTGSSIPATAAVPGLFKQPDGVAVDQETGDVYIADATAKVVDEFGPEGEFITQYGEVPAGPGVTVSGPFGDPVSVAVDSSGDLFVADAEKGVVDEWEQLPPTALLSAASGVGVASATANGSVNPNGVEVTSCLFEYGTSEHEPDEHSAPCVTEHGTPIGSRDAAVPVSAELAGLGVHTTYYYRLVVKAGPNTTVSSAPEVSPFTTSAVAPAITAVSASGITQSAATLAGAIDPHNAMTAYHFVYGTTSAYGSVIPVTELFTPVINAPYSVTPQEIVGLAPDTTYHYALVASGPGGVTQSADQTFTTIVDAPTVTTTAGASAITQSAATVAGTVDPNSGALSSCEVQYGTTSGYGSEAGCTSLPGGGASPVGVSASLSGLSASTTYHFRLVATNAGGTTYGSDQTFTTEASPAIVLVSVPTTVVPTTKSTPKALTSAQKLAKALKACKRDKSHKQRQACEKQARKRYGPKKKTDSTRRKSR
jgi:hypothetical protein